MIFALEVSFFALSSGKNTAPDSFKITNLNLSRHNSRSDGKHCSSRRNYTYYYLSRIVQHEYSVMNIAEKHKYKH